MFSLSSPQEERAGERRPLLLNAPLPSPLPTRASRGEGENFWWLYQDAPHGECPRARLEFQKPFAFDCDSGTLPRMSKTSSTKFAAYPRLNPLGIGQNLTVADLIDQTFLA